MPLRRIRLGDLVSRVNQKCNIPHLSVWEVSGINKDKVFFEPSKQVGADTSNYKEVPPGCFACNLMHIGRDMVFPFALNRTSKAKYVSPAYTIFKLIDETVLIKEYLYILLNSPEKDRYFWFHCDSSVRDGMEWDSFCNIEVEIPPLKVQQKYVAIYDGLLANLSAFEDGLDDLKLVCDGFIEDLRKRIGTVAIGSFLEQLDERNTDLSVKLALGVDNKKTFVLPKQVAKTERSAKIVRTGCFAYNRATTRNGDKISIAYREGPDCVVSSAYGVFRIKDEGQLNPKYLLMWFRRSEFDRYARYMSKGSAHEFFEFSDMEEVRIPIPDKSTQDAIVSVLEIIEKRQNILKRIKQQLSGICPVLVRGSLVEAEVI